MKKIIVFIVVLALAGMAQAEILSANRGFEAGNTTDWLQWASGAGGTGGWQSWLDTFTVINDGTAYEGDYYGQLTQSLSGGQTWGYNVAWQGEVPVISAGPGNYTMSAWVRSTTTTQAILKLEAWDNDPCGINNLLADERLNAIVADGTWQFITADFVLPAGTASVRAVIGDNTGAFSIDYDAVSLVPEPMTIALLGLGGLFLRRRKRKA